MSEELFKTKIVEGNPALFERINNIRIHHAEEIRLNSAVSQTANQIRTQELFAYIQILENIIKEA